MRSLKIGYFLILKMDVLALAIAMVMQSSTIPKSIVKQLHLQPCNCVLTARVFNTDLPRGLYSLSQKKRIINSKEPTIGATVITNEGNWTGHAATVVGVTEDTVTLLEANYKRCKVTTRVLDKDSKKIVGYYS